MKKIVSTTAKIITSILILGLLLGYASPYFHPNTITFLPFFGLSYPIFAGGVITFMLIWAVFKSKWAVFCLFFLLIGGKLHFRSFAYNLTNTSDSIENPDNKLKLLSYNVRLFGIYEPTNAIQNRDGIFSFLRKENPDVACFQEFYRQDKPTNFETFDSLMSSIHAVDYHERSAHKISGRQNFGIAMFSKYPMIAKGDVMFDTQSSSDFNYCIFADIVKGKDTFRIYNVHLQSIRLQEGNYTTERIGNQRVPSKSTILKVIKKLRLAYQKRADQARRVVEHASNSPYPSVICGDFNDTPMSYCYNQFNRKYIDAFRNSSWGIGSTYIGRLPAGRIDYIFHTPTLNSSEFQVHSEKLSDHRAISCKIEKL